MLHFGVIGYPVAHSLSPQIHGAAFKAANIEAISERIEVKPEALPDFMKNFHEKYSGVNVTIPHKETIITFLDEIDEEAKAIGAVNLIVNRNGKLIGYNVDMYGAVMTLYEIIGSAKTTSADLFLQGLSVTILGAGGASHAVCFGVLKYGGNLTILNRHKDRAKHIADDFSRYFPGRKIQIGELTDFGKEPMDILINTTPCGMTPNENETPILDAEQKFRLLIKKFSKKPLVMDIVYRPRKTKFLQEAERAGLKTITGERMFLHQAAKGFELWTDQKAPFEAMEKAVSQELSLF